MKPAFFCVQALLLSTLAGAAHAKPASWVQLSAQPNAKQYVTGEPIVINLTAKNTASRDAWLHFSSGQRFDVQLFNPNTKSPVYTWSTSRMFAMMTGHLRIASGASQTFEVQIGDEQGALVPGQYEVRAALTNSSRIQAPPVQIEVVAPKVAPAAMQLKVSTDKTQYKMGEPVAFTLSLSNTSKETRELKFNSGQRFDITLVDTAGTPVWNWSANKRFGASLSSLSLAPGESKTFEATWEGVALPDHKIVPGIYSVRATLTSNPPLDSAPVNIEIK